MSEKFDQESAGARFAQRPNCAQRERASSAIVELKEEGASNRPVKPIRHAQPFSQPLFGEAMRTRRLDISALYLLQ